MSNEFDAFDVRSVVEDGIKLDLNLPDGSPSGHWLKVRNYRCAPYRQVLAEITARVAEKGPPDAAQKHADRLALLVALTADWSFETKLTPESARDFFDRAMLVRDQVDRAVVDDSLFFGKGSTPSTGGSSKS